jgi:hypothetical protein
MNRKLILFSLLALFVVAVGIIAFSQAYPAALVDWRPVSLDSFNRESAAAMHYYKKAVEVYGSGSLPVETEDFKNEIRRAVLDKLVEDKIVEAALAERLEKKDIKNLVEKKIAEISVSAGEGIEEKVMTIYGISMADFKKEILEPQARMEILESRFLLESDPDSDFNNWLDSLKANSKVSVLIPGFSWKDNKVALSE